MNVRLIGAVALLLLAIEAHAQQCDAGLTTARYLDVNNGSLPTRDLRVPKHDPDLVHKQITSFVQVEVTSQVPRKVAKVGVRAADGLGPNLYTSSSHMTPNDMGGSAVKIFTVDVPANKFIPRYSHNYIADVLTDDCKYPVEGTLHIGF